MSKRLSLDKLGKGGLCELVNHELQAVSANIWNPNTSATAKRKIIITLEIAPDENRQIGVVNYSTKSTLCSVKGGSTRFVFGYNEHTREGEYSEFNAEMLGQVSVEDIEALAADKAEQSEARAAKIIDLRRSAGGNE